MKNIFAVALNQHDHNTYDGNTHILFERYTRVKTNQDSYLDPEWIKDFYQTQFVDRYNNTKDLVAYTSLLTSPKSAWTINTEEHLQNRGIELSKNLLEMFKKEREFVPSNLWDYAKHDRLYYIDHHQSHAACSFLTSGYKESDILCLDGGGYNFHAIFVDRHGRITDLSKRLHLGYIWNYVTHITGMKTAGRTMGIVAYGKVHEELYSTLKEFLRLAGMKISLAKKLSSPSFMKMVTKYRVKDVACTLQKLTLDTIREEVLPLQTSNNLCLGGGVAYNGYMNEMLLNYYDNVHVPPATGDEGQALGVYMHADYVLNNNIKIPSVYSGALHKVNEDVFDGPLNLTEIAQAIADGAIIGWYQGRSESGNRALGNRSILADPRNPNIKDIINKKIKLREDYRPFAPSVLVEHYKEYFDTRIESPYMSRIMPVISDKIPGVTHIDGTARIQTVRREFNPNYYDLINEFYKITGIPMLLNTSFNCQEPIVETPEEAMQTFKRTGLDILVVNDLVKRK